jgi:hypothetical protein
MIPLDAFWSNLMLQEIAEQFWTRIDKRYKMGDELFKHTINEDDPPWKPDKSQILTIAESIKKHKREG